MKLSALLRQACQDLGISMSELARRTNQSPQNLSMKMKRDTIPFKEFLEYMDALDVKVDLALKYPNGDVPEKPIIDDRIREKIEILEDTLALERRNNEYQKKLGTDARTTMYNIQGYVDKALKNPKDTATLIEYLGKIKAAGSYLNAIFEDPTDTDAGTNDDTINPVSAQSIIGLHILIAEDNEMNREITKDMLEENGVVVETAIDGDEAVKIIEVSEPGDFDCILMDIQMPILDGIEATKRIRALPNRIRAGIPIIAMTANTFESDKKTALRAGMDGYLTKPVSAQKMIAEIAKLV